MRTEVLVLDASAVLALLLGEPGAERVKAVLDGAILGVVNLAEVVGHYAKLGASREDIAAMLGPLPIQIAPADAEPFLRSRTAAAHHRGARFIVG